MRLMKLTRTDGRTLAVSPAHVVAVIEGQEHTGLVLAFHPEHVFVKEPFVHVQREWEFALTGAGWVPPERSRSRECCDDCLAHDYGVCGNRDCACHS
jgi:hypothetical protein